MDNEKLSFTDWEFWVLGSSYGVVFWVVLMAILDNSFNFVRYGVVAIFGAFAMFILAISCARRKRNKRWLNAFNDKYSGSLDLDVVVAVTNRVCGQHRVCPPRIMFRLVAEALYHRSRNVPPVNTFHRWAINAYEELYGD